MALHALLFLNCDYRVLKETVKAIGKIKGVRESNATSGAYDAVLKVETRSENELRQVIKSVAAVSGVVAIVTSIVIGAR
jgi:DNA-binding Lrp family transcriptional regulator